MGRSFCSSGGAGASTVVDLGEFAVNLDWAVLRNWSKELLTAAGLEVDAARDTVANLEYAERRGHTSHGYLRLPTYVNRVRAGGINRTPSIVAISDSAVLAVVDADAAIGAHSAIWCTDLAVAKATDVGAGIVIARNASHFGAAGMYTDRMAAAGFAGIAACNTDAVMSAPFGGRAVLGTNPISIAVPGAGGVRPNLDMASSAVAHGKVVAARNAGNSVPNGWVVDADGHGTTDPAAGLAGALLPSAGPKGFGLAFMIDCLVAIGGARTSNEVGALYGNPAVRQELGHIFIAIAVDHVQTPSQYSDRVAALTAAVHASETSGSTQPPLVPGEPSRERFIAAAAWTPVPTTTHQLVELSNELGVPVPSELAGSH